MDSDEVASDGEITKGRKRRELLRRMKRSGRQPDNKEEKDLRKVHSILVEFSQSSYSHSSPAKQSCA